MPRAPREARPVFLCTGSLFPRIKRLYVSGALFPRIKPLYVPGALFPRIKPLYVPGALFPRVKRLYVPGALFPTIKPLYVSGGPFSEDNVALAYTDHAYLLPSLECVDLYLLSADVMVAR